MKLKFTKEQTEKLIKAYYKMYWKKEIEVRPVVSKGCEGRYETSCVNVKMVVTSKLEVLSQTIMGEIELSKAEVTDILKTVLAEEGFEVESIFYDAGIDDGDRFHDSYFSGMNVEGKQSMKQKRKVIN